MKNHSFPNILFVLVDGLRADYFFGKNKKANTPNIDSIIKSGVYFKNAISSSDITAYSLKTIFSGCFPFGCGKTKEKFERTYSEKTSYLTTLKNSGYHLYAHMGKAIFNQGFQNVFENEDVTSTDSVHNGLAEKVIEKISSEKLKNPWFFYLHPIDVHVPCEVPKKFANLSLEERYNFNIKSIDLTLGKILEHIDLENTIFVLTADHGEYLNPFDTYKGIQEKNNFLNKTMKKSIKKIIPKSMHATMHSKKKSIQTQMRSSNFEMSHEKRNLEERPGKHRMLFDDIVHVPLLVAGNGISHCEPISLQVGIVDIFPTILEIIGIEDNQQINGHSLKPLLNKEKYSPFPIYLENAMMKTEIKNSTSCLGIRTSNFKYFRDLSDPKKNVNLYDLENDPLEDFNIAKNNHEKINEFEKIIFELKRESPVEEKLNDLSEKETKEIEDELKKLGYI